MPDRIAPTPQISTSLEALTECDYQLDPMAAFDVLQELGLSTTDEINIIGGPIAFKNTKPEIEEISEGITAHYLNILPRRETTEPAEVETERMLIDQANQNAIRGLQRIVRHHAIKSNAEPTTRPTTVALEATEEMKNKRFGNILWATIGCSALTSANSYFVYKGGEAVDHNLAAVAVNAGMVCLSVYGWWQMVKTQKPNQAIKPDEVKMSNLEQVSENKLVVDLSKSFKVVIPQPSLGYEI